MSGDGRAWPLTTQQSEGSGAEMEVRIKISGSETSAGLGKLGQKESESLAVEHLRGDVLIGALGTQER